MKTNVTKDMFIDTFKGSQYNENFSIEGLSALYDWYTEQEEETEVEVDLDLPAIAQEWQEHSSTLDYISDYDLEEEIGGLDEEEGYITKKLFGYIRNKGAIAIRLGDGGILSTNI